MRLNMLGLLAMLALSLAAPFTANAQQTRTWRIGFLSLVSENLEQYRPWLAAFRDRLRELGYVEGENVVIEQRYAAGQVERLPALAAELIRLKVDILVVAPSGSAVAAKRATNTIPIVFMGEPDPVGTGLVGNLARPGGNVTGLADAHSDLIPKRLELLRQLTPSTSRIGVLWNASNASTRPQFRAIQAAAPALGLSAVSVEVKGPARADLDRAFATIGSDRLGGLLVVDDPTLGNLRNRIAELAIAHRLPTSGTHRGWGEGGLLMSYGTDFVEMLRQGAVLVDKILKGARPADLPVAQPTKFELTINAKTAKALGLAIPPSVAARADSIIQ
jgi:putative ABC transport system substrate-binding protein